MLRSVIGKTKSGGGVRSNQLVVPRLVDSVTSLHQLDE